MGHGTATGSSLRRRWLALGALIAALALVAVAWARVTRARASLFPTGEGPHSAVVGDFDGDGWPDVATANLTSGTVSVLSGRHDGTLSDPAEYRAGDQAHGITAADFNRDGRLDLAASNVGSNDVFVLHGRPGGGF